STYCRRRSGDSISRAAEKIVSAFRFFPDIAGTPNVPLHISKRENGVLRLTQARVFIPDWSSAGGRGRNRARSWRNANTGRPLHAKSPAAPQLPRPTGPRKNGA